MNLFYRACILLITLTMMVGCATNRGVIEIQDVPVANPSQGVGLKFSRISDNRAFELKPAQASTPSLKNGEIEDTEITSRAIARKRNGYGMALGDILLPEGRTVAEVVQNRLTKGFQENGYRVLTPGDANYDSAIPLDVDINKFWGWMSPGFLSIGLNFQTAIDVTAPIKGLENSIEVDSEVQKRFQTAAGRNWKTVIDLSLDELSADILKELN